MIRAISSPCHFHSISASMKAGNVVGIRLRPKGFTAGHGHLYSNNDLTEIKGRFEGTGKQNT